ncbi:hypothetical protein [Haloplanus rallus]|uniref:hypothetical protein n=1 Tax=Haloplanus rallus TaxID=1816183 RepID=UPI0012FDDE9D|nr:hypothetical protein [Haloplanus rallus]
MAPPSSPSSNLGGAEPFTTPVERFEDHFGASARGSDPAAVSGTGLVVMRPA